MAVVLDMQFAFYLQHTHTHTHTQCPSHESLCTVCIKEDNSRAPVDRSVDAIARESGRRGHSTP